MKVGELEEYLTEHGWAPEAHGQGTLRAEHSSDEGPIVVYIRISGEWLIVSVVPFLATRGNNSFELSRWLLRQNRDMNQAKFAYDEDGDVILTIEVPTESLDHAEIDSALKELVSRTVQHRATLRAAAEAAR